MNSWTLDCKIWPRKIRNIILSYLDILNRLGVDRQRDRRTDRQNYDNNIVRLTTRAKSLFARTASDSYNNE